MRKGVYIEDSEIRVAQLFCHQCQWCYCYCDINSYMCTVMCVLQDLRQTALSQTVDIEELERGVHSSISAVKVCMCITCTIGTSAAR